VLSDVYCLYFLMHRGARRAHDRPTTVTIQEQCQVSNIYYPVAVSTAHAYQLQSSLSVSLYNVVGAVSLVAAPPVCAPDCLYQPGPRLKYMYHQVPRPPLFPLSRADPTKQPHHLLARRPSAVAPCLTHRVHSTEPTQVPAFP
jgi:hypothetical protein